MTRYRIIYGTGTGELIGYWHAWPVMLVWLRYALHAEGRAVLRVEDDRACW